MSENEQDALRPDSLPAANEDQPATEAAITGADQPAEEPSVSLDDGMHLADTSASNGQPSPENQLPPEAQGEANGGPLGCCLGVMVGLLLSLSLAILSRVYAGPLGALLQGNYGLLGLLVRILMGVLAVALAILFGSFGWKLGRRFYREYEPPVVKRRQRRSKVKKV